jgi:hypothetical protein
MVVSHIIGGIGNQMFQYAAGRALSLTNNQQLLLDLSDFSDYRLHNGFELSRVFNVIAERAETSTIHQLLGWRANRLVKKVLRRPQLVWLRGKNLVVEPHFNYWPDLFNLTDDCYLSGYWQSERYFQFYTATIRADFTFKSPLVSDNAALAKQITQVNAVSLHVRRGDYVSNPKTTATHGVCSLDYYRAAIHLIVERVQQPYFYIFSDDIIWAKDNLKIDFPHQYVDYNHGLESYNDMHLMSLCQHHIIANSSFSWWGAWLNPNMEKIVVAPKKWFTNENNVKDLFPQDWVTL